MSDTIITAPADQPQVLIEREFDAPVDLVFRAYTDPDLVAKWLGPRRLELIWDHVDMRDGGTWRYVHKDTDGAEYGFHGVFHGTPSPDGIVQTFEFEGAPGHVSLDTATFTDLGGGRTLVRGNSVFQSVADRDAMVSSGMEVGVRESYERLAELLPTL